MVSEYTLKGQVVFECDDCKLCYKEREWAIKCETWCTENHSCNLEITSHALK